MSSSPAPVFEWRPTKHPKRDRNRKRIRLGFGVAALLVAIGAAVSSWSDGVVNVVASMFVPVLILLIGFGIDRIYDAGRNFSIRADGISLTIHRGGRAAPAVIPVSELTGLRVASQRVAAPNGTHGSAWHIVAERRNDKAVDVILPTFLGTTFGRDDAHELEAELRRRCRLT